MRSPLPLLALTLSLSCATVAGSSEHGRRIELPELRVVAQPIGPDGLEVYDAETLFQRALDFLDGDAYADAAWYFERLIREFPEDRRVPLAHYNRAVAYIHLERGDEAVVAIDKYLAMLKETASTKDRLDGRFKRGQALAVAKRYDEVATHFDELLGEELTPEDRIEALVDAGVGHYMLGAHDSEGPHRYTAEYRFLEARRLYRKASETARLDVAYFIAQAAFYLAEIARLEFSEKKLAFPSAAAIADAQLQAQQRAAKGAVPPEVTLEKLLGEQLEEKCQRLLRAQYAYLRTIREEHPGWASASGYNVGQMYLQLHDEMVQLPTPADLTAEQAALYQKVVRKRVMILLTKAQQTWSSTVDMVTRTGAESEWAVRTRDSLEQLRQKLLEESSATADVDNEGNDIATTPAGSGAS